ncbi:hypothetical protein [Rhodococcus opacus]|uniref:Uncharacterized protein n=1 Tax=Rhodococcus opacus (strain B4) TaxID=632772 RepID=C1B9F4_RHOOB|nr:hypothetical protein [Rhodococcus opacus]BAH52307.1 hypothetical protein ROP_40600 [Rhodococcus opacus B4]
MPLFNRGQAPLRMVLGGQQVLRVILDGVVVWDGTRPALVQLARLRATVAFPAPVVRADAVPDTVPVLSTIGAAMPAPSGVVGSAVVQAPRMQTTVALPTPGLITDTEVDVLPAEISVVMLTATASENFDGVVSAPPMTVAAAMPVPVVATGFFVAAVSMSVSAAMGTPIVTVSSTGMVPAVSMLASVSMPAPAVTAGVNVAAVKQMVNALMPVPVIFAQRNVNIAAVKMSGSAAMNAPVVSGSMNPQGMQRTTAALTLAQNTYTKITPMQAKSGYESTITSDGLVMPGGGVCNLFARITWNLNSASERRIRIVKNGSTVLGETISSGTHTTLDVTVNNVTLTASDVLTVEGYSTASTSSGRVLDTAAGVTYLTVTPN